MSNVLTIVVTYNASSWLETCIGSLIKSKVRSDIALVDNASSDNTTKLIEEHYAEAIRYYFPSKENLGFGKAHNLVFENVDLSVYDFIFLLNQDAAISTEGIGALIRVANARPSYGIVSPVHYFKPGEMDRPFSRYYKKFRLRTDDYSDGEVQVCSFVNAAIWLIKRDVIDKIGGFDPLFSHYGEDLNFVQRASKAGYEIAIAEWVSGFHYRSQDSTGLENKPLGQQLYIQGLIELLNPLNRFWPQLYHVTGRFILKAFNSARRLRFEELGGILSNLIDLSKLIPRVISSRNKMKQ